MAYVSDFRKWVELACPGAPIPLVDDAIVAALREFCSATHRLQDRVTLITIPEQSVYALSLPADTELLSVKYIRGDDMKYLHPYSDAVLTARPAASGRPDSFSVIDSVVNQIRLYPTPNSAVQYSVAVVLRPTLTAETVDDRILTLYKDGIVAYAKHYLMMQPGKPWSNPDYARLEYRRFESVVGSAIIDKTQQRMDFGISVKMRPMV